MRKNLFLYLAYCQVNFYWMSFLFLFLKPILFLMAKKLFKKQMKAFIIKVLEEYVKQTDNDIDDLLVGRVKSAMKLGMV